MLDICTLGSRIKNLRKQRGLTQNAFAEAIHVSFQAVSNWERGIAPPDLENLVNIAAFFGVLVDDLLRPCEEKLFLGVDGGGTKTEFAVVDADGHILYRFVREGSNPNDIGLQNAFDVISGGIRDALIKFPQISYAFCGIAGITVGDCRERITRLLNERFPTLTFELDSDAANLFGMDDDADMVVISGTGSVVFTKQDGTFKRIGGWGYLFDSAGSAYDIGRDAVSAALNEEDLHEPPSYLTQLLQKELKVPCIFDAINKLHSGGRAYIASLAPLVFEAYIKGDKTTVSIIDENAKRLGELLSYGVRLYGAKGKAVTGGSMFKHYGDILLPHIAKYTDVQIIVPEISPIYGACRQSVKLSGQEIPDTFELNFKNSYGGKTE